MNNSKTAILLSGGMDSYALTYLEKPDFAITINYGQKPAQAEFQSSKILTERLSIQHVFLNVDLSNLGSGDLNGKSPAAQAPASDWWPYRNQALITLSAMKLLPFNVDRLLIASVNTDSNMQDGTSNFINKMSALLSLQEGNMTLEAPAIHMSTSELIIKSEIPYSLLAWSHSCHTQNIACGQCRGCNKHREVVCELGYGNG